MLVYYKIIMIIFGVYSVSRASYRSVSLSNPLLKPVMCAFSSLVITACMGGVDTPSGPSATAPLNPVTGQSFTKVFANGSLLDDASAEWSCVRDNRTGLVWERKQANDAVSNTLRQANSTYTWYNDDSGVAGGTLGDMSSTTTCDGALTTCDTQSYVAAINAVGLCGVSDWRMPTKEELLSILDRGADEINSAYFDNHNAGEAYWTLNSEPQEAAQPKAFVVEFDGGVEVSTEAKNALNAVRLVRGSWATSTTDTCDGVGLYITKPDAIYTAASTAADVPLATSQAFVDSQTGLMWKVQAGPSSLFSAAMSAAGSAVDFGFDDWRLPTITELHSLVDVGCPLNVTNQNVLNFSGTAWSSTLDASAAGNAFTMNFSSGMEGSVSNSSSHQYLLVRSAY